MRLSILEPFRQPPGPVDGHAFENLTVDSACEQIRNWHLTGRTLFKLEDSPDRWICFECKDSGDFETSFQSSPDAWQKVIGVKFNVEGCCQLAKTFFNGDQSLLRKYPLDTRTASKRLTSEELENIQGIQERLCTRRWWQFWK